LKRGQLYQLLNAGVIRSVSLRRPGHKQGTRLFHLASISSFLNSRMAEQSLSASASSNNFGEEAQTERGRAN
jgi:hypothetical protein